MAPLDPIRFPTDYQPEAKSPAPLAPLRRIVTRRSSEFGTYTVEALECGHEFMPPRDPWYGQDLGATRRRCRPCQADAARKASGEAR